MAEEVIPTSYFQFLKELKERIRTAQVRAIVSVNREMILLYWQIGRDILKRQDDEGWGTKVIDRLANDLRGEFPDMRGFSPRNLKYMRAFAEAWQDEQIVQEVLAQITWYHNITLIDKVKERTEREWYISKTIENGWSRNVMVHQIESDLYNRKGRAITNFDKTLPAPLSDLARQSLKDPYVFDFLSLEDNIQESELEKGLIQHIRDFLLELGVGFAFVGSQYHLEIGEQDYYIDLLFYHLKLRSYIAIDLKMGEFKPEYAGKMNFYLAALDDILRLDTDRPSIGIILCKSKNRIIVEYALRDTGKPIGVAEYHLTNKLPASLRGNIPERNELEEKLLSAVEDDE